MKNGRLFFQNFHPASISHHSMDAWWFFIGRWLQQYQPGAKLPVSSKCLHEFLFNDPSTLVNNFVSFPKERSKWIKGESVNEEAEGGK